VKLFAGCRAALQCQDIAAKLQATRALQAAWNGAELAIDGDTPLHPIERPGYPQDLRLVAPRELPQRSTATGAGRLALIHAIAHIEFNAVHLALDACYRFRGLPREYYGDWLGVAAEEAHHFALLAACLERRGAFYGAFPAHNGLWEMATQTADDALARMALVPRVMEARGLDVTPGIRRRFAAAGDDEVIRILDIILRDEIGHVATGNRWYHHLCAERGLDPESTFLALARKHRAPKPALPINRAARVAAGFTDRELDALGTSEKDDPAS
jgi:uncharacterized ferritin-like protein (DUF455 family)